MEFHEYYNIDSCRSYATIEALQKALVRYGFDKDRYVIVWNSKGRCTAIFPGSNIQGGYVGVYAQKGFLTLG